MNGLFIRAPDYCQPHETETEKEHGGGFGDLIIFNTIIKIQLEVVTTVFAMLFGIEKNLVSRSGHVGDPETNVAVHQLCDGYIRKIRFEYDLIQRTSVGSIRVYRVMPVVEYRVGGAPDSGRTGYRHIGSEREIGDPRNRGQPPITRYPLISGCPPFSPHFPPT